MEKIIIQTIKEYSTIYQNLLKNFYPKDENDPNGFEERNMTNNFVNALKIFLSDENAISWFEASWGRNEKLDTVTLSPKKGSEKLDAIVLSPKNNSIFFIEAKRFSNSSVKSSVDRKINLLKKDFNRILYNKPNRESVISRYRDGKNIFQHQYIVCLADLWIEKPETINISNEWKANKIIEEKKDITKITYCDVVHFCKFTDDFLNKRAINMYNLLISVSEILND